jgi:hypothetical protein
MAKRVFLLENVVIFFKILTNCLHLNVFLVLTQARKLFEIMQTIRNDISYCLQKLVEFQNVLTKKLDSFEKFYSESEICLQGHK